MEKSLSENENYRIYLSNVSQEDQLEKKLENDVKEEALISSAGDFRITFHQQLDLHKTLRFKAADAELAISHFQIDSTPLTFCQSNYFEIIYTVNELAASRNLFHTIRSVRSENRRPHRVYLTEISIISENQLITFLNTSISKSIFRLQIMKLLELICDTPIFRKSAKETTYSQNHKNWDASLFGLLNRYLDIARFSRKFLIKIIDNLSGFTLNQEETTSEESSGVMNEMQLYEAEIIDRNRENKILEANKNILLTNDERGMIPRFKGHKLSMFVKLRATLGIDLNKNGEENDRQPGSSALQNLKKSLKDDFLEMVNITAMSKNGKSMWKLNSETKQKTLTSEAISDLRETRNTFVKIINLIKVINSAISAQSKTQLLTSSPPPKSAFFLKKTMSDKRVRKNKLVVEFPQDSDKLFSNDFEMSFEIKFDGVIGHILGNTSSDITKSEVTIGPIFKKARELTRPLLTTESRLTKNIKYEDQQLFAGMHIQPKSLFIWTDMVTNQAVDSPSWGEDERLRGYYPIYKIELTEECFEKDFIQESSGSSHEFHQIKMQELAFNSFRGIITDEYFRPIQFPYKTYLYVNLIVRACPW